MRIVAVPEGTIVVEIHDDPSCSVALARAIGLAAGQRRDLTLVHALAVEARFGTDPPVLRVIIAAVVEAGQELLAAAHDEVRRVAPELLVREVLRLVDAAEALADLRAGAAELLPAGTKVPPAVAVGT
jgi:hypothetical protein